MLLNGKSFAMNFQKELIKRFTLKRGKFISILFHRNSIKIKKNSIACARYHNIQSKTSIVAFVHGFNNIFVQSLISLLL